jgi:hypothetical protein
VRVGAYLRSLQPSLSREVYVLRSGLVVNAFGNGAANPFLVVYGCAPPQPAASATVAGK